AGRTAGEDAPPRPCPPPAPRPPPRPAPPPPRPTSHTPVRSGSLASAAQSAAAGAFGAAFWPKAAGLRASAAINKPKRISRLHCISETDLPSEDSIFYLIRRAGRYKRVNPYCAHSSYYV